MVFVYNHFGNFLLQQKQSKTIWKIVIWHSEPHFCLFVLFVHLSNCPFVHLSNSPCFCLSNTLFAFLSLYLSVCRYSFRCKFNGSSSVCSALVTSTTLLFGGGLVQPTKTASTHLISISRLSDSLLHSKQHLKGRRAGGRVKHRLNNGVTKYSANWILAWWTINKKANKSVDLIRQQAVLSIIDRKLRWDFLRGIDKS